VLEIMDSRGLNTAIHKVQLKQRSWAQKTPLIVIRGVFCDESFIGYRHPGKAWT
jgi:hypothetical protein